mgnify:CR=1 FL=1
MKTNGWLTLSLAVYVAGSVASSAAHSPSSSAHPKKAAPSAGAAKHTAAPKPAAPAPAAAAATALQTGPAEVTQEHVNVRAQADVDSEVVSRLSRNDVVKVLEEVTLKKAGPGEPTRWAKISWPEGAPVWVYADFVDKASMQVKVAKLNLRTGPGENHSVVGHLEKGATLKKLDAKGDWLKVEAPDSCVAFVAANLLKSKASATESASVGSTPTVPATGLRPATPASPRPTPPPLPATTTTEVPRDILVSQPKPAPVPTFSLPPPQIPRPAPATAPASLAGIAPTISTPPALVPPPATKPAAASPAPLVSGSESKPAATPAPVLTREPGEIDFRPQREETYVKRVVTREGLVRRSYNIQSPTSLVLENVHNGRVMNYLYSTSTNMNLNAYRGRVVTLTGEEALDERWPNTPVIRVETLQTDP